MKALKRATAYIQEREMFLFAALFRNYVQEVDVMQDDKRMA